jgi:hypothetical protein
MRNEELCQISGSQRSADENVYIVRIDAVYIGN